MQFKTKQNLLVVATISIIVGIVALLFITTDFGSGKSVTMDRRTQSSNILNGEARPVGSISSSDAVASKNGSSAKTNAKAKEPTGSGSSANTVVTRVSSSNYKFSDALRELYSNTAISPTDRAVASSMIHARCWLIMNEIQTRAPPAVSKADPHYMLRMKQYEAVARRTRRDRCEGIEPSELTASAVRSKWQDAARTGDPRAQAAVIDYQLKMPDRIAQTKTILLAGEKLEVTSYRGPTAEETDTVLRGLSSRDPAFIASFGDFFNQTFADVDFIFGDRGEKFSPEAGDLFWELVACQFGAECGNTNPLVAKFCAFEGKCSVQNLEDYIRGHALNGDQWEQIQRLLPLVVTAINSGNWANVITRKSPPSGVGPFNNNPSPIIITTGG